MSWKEIPGQWRKALLGKGELRLFSVPSTSYSCSIVFIETCLDYKSSVWCRGYSNAAKSSGQSINRSITTPSHSCDIPFRVTDTRLYKVSSCIIESSTCSNVSNPQRMTLACLPSRKERFPICMHRLLDYCIIMRYRVDMSGISQPNLHSM